MGRGNIDAASDWEYHDCRMLGDKGYLGAEIQKNLFEAANIMFEVTYRLNQKNRCSAIWSFSGPTT